MLEITNGCETFLNDETKKALELPIRNLEQ